MPDETPRPVRIWDLPTRVFHWTLLFAVLALIVSGKVGGNALAWHMRLGLLVLALLGFRLVWGFIGGHWSRFASFVRGPSTVMRYLRGEAGAGEHLEVGHNPLGAFSVLAMLAVLALQVATGLVVDDEIATTGPLNRFVSAGTASAATAWHKGPGQVLVFALVALHVAAVLYYRFAKGRDLVSAMLKGDKALPGDVPAAEDGAGARLRALVVAALWVAAAVAIARLAA